ncbi:MAG TPA: GNAT family N-acetyltransferase [Pyrinomonadaceae bacterium]|nr:GNAT family N-acetyltransferase [Pyrinomonadaceae bacterium]
MNEKLLVRPARAGDITAIAVLIREFAEFEKLSDWCEVTENDLQQAIFGKGSFVQALVALSGNVYVGYAIFFPVFKSFRGERSVFLEDLYVTPEKRGQGLGFVMLAEVAKYAKTLGFTRMDWQALKWNAPAVDFYKNLGAELDDENLDFRLRGENFNRLAS